MGSRKQSSALALRGCVAPAAEKADFDNVHNSLLAGSKQVRLPVCYRL